MSVCVSAILGHSWNDFSDEIVQRISRAISAEGTPPRWRPNPSFKTPEKEDASDKNLMIFLPEGFSLYFGKHFLILDHTDRWSTYLVNADSRRRFLIACSRLLHLTDAKEILLLPEGTELMDLYYDSVPFEDVKFAAAKKWGPPNLDFHRIYSEEEIYKNSGKRVDYFLIDRMSLEHALAPATNK